MLSRRHIVAYTILLIMITAIWASSNLNWGSGRSTRIIKVDGNGYYAYLPAIFIYHDLEFGFFDEIASKEGYQNMGYDYRYQVDGKVVNKYFAGTALAQLPFFLAAHFICWLTGQPMDGYSALYLIFINIASLFYLLLSCIYINKILEIYKVSDLNRLIVLVATVFGTNLFYYSVYEPSMSHIYSLGFISLFIYTTLRYYQSFQPKFLLLSALILGIIILIRPVNLLILASVPFLAGDLDNLKKVIFVASSQWRYLLFAIIILIVPLLLQAAIYKIQTGSFWVYSYGDERFYFSNPHMLEILFSYRKGLFVYTPLWFVSLAGLYFIWKKSASLAAFWTIFFLILTYVLSCWHQWFYGGSFGSRAYIEYYALFSILLGVFLENVTSKLTRPILISVITILIVISVIQTYQYYAGIIHWSDMNRELYWEVFLRFK
jgi:hypothetical protein